MVAVTPSDTIDNVCQPNPYWSSVPTYPIGATVYLGSNGKTWQAKIANNNISPTESATWTEVSNVQGLASIIFCNGVAGNVAILTYGGETVTLAVAASDLLAKGTIRVRRVLATGTTATLLFAIAGGI